VKQVSPGPTGEAGSVPGPRTLIYLPIVHTQADLGSLGESVKRAAVKKSGTAAWRRKAQAIDKLWTGIEQVIDALQLDYARVRLYQDGLPVCGREVEIVRDLARRGSRNHQLLARLMARGATLMGTESSDLLVQEYQLARKALAGGASGPASPARKPGESDAVDAVLESRNRYIAARINATLRPGETGILFLGMLHSLKGRLDPDIQVIYPLKPPPEERG